MFFFLHLKYLLFCIFVPFQLDLLPKENANYSWLRNGNIRKIVAGQNVANTLPIFFFAVRLAWKKKDEKSEKITKDKTDLKEKAENIGVHQ